MHNNVNATSTIQVKVLLNSFDLSNKVIMYVKNKWLNIVIFTFTLTCVYLWYSWRTPNSLKESNVIPK